MSDGKINQDESQSNSSKTRIKIAKEKEIYQKQLLFQVLVYLFHLPEAKKRHLFLKKKNIYM